jgi:hypothetical protein
MDKSTQSELHQNNYKHIYEHNHKHYSTEILQHNNVLLEDNKAIFKEKNKELDEVNTIELLLSQIDINTTKNNCEKTCSKDLNEVNNKDLNKVNNKDLVDVNNKDLVDVNKNTSINGYKEEELVCNDLNINIDLRNIIIEISGHTYDYFLRNNDNSKCDIQSTNKLINVQVKKYKKNRFQHLDRHWIDTLITDIPELKSIDYILKNLCEKPILCNGITIDTSKHITKLCSTNYSQTILDNFIYELNKNKKKILNYVFLGTDKDKQPDFLIGIEYVNNKRTKLILFKIADIIIYLETLNFNITKGKTVIKLGNDSIISLQRKGGDNGNKSSNHLQFKIIVSKLLDKVNNKQYNL